MDELNEKRTPRSLETREKNERSKPWKPPNLLPDPNPEAGYVYRWIRTSAAGQSDNLNVSTRFREGWEPVRAEDHPELEIVTDSDSKYPNCIEVGGLLLCKAPEEDVANRKKYYQDLSERQMTAVDSNYMKEENPAMPMFKERKTKVTFGKGGQ